MGVTVLSIAGLFSFYFFGLFLFSALVRAMLQAFEKKTELTCNTKESIEVKEVGRLTTLGG